jgi:UDP-N-acetylmuramate dehydrogenase
VTAAPGPAHWTGLRDAARDAGLRAELECDLGARTTYRVGGRAALGVWVNSADDARLLGRLVADAAPDMDAIQVLPVGNGSNLLVSDAGFAGVAVFIADGRTADEDPVPLRAPGEVRTIVHVSAAAMLPSFARRCVAAGWCGAEWMVGVPGTVGGAVRMNAGGHGSDMAAMLVSVDIVDLTTGARATIAAADLGLRFRGSALADRHLVTRAALSLVDPGEHVCADELSTIVAWRRDRQPGGHNAGSVFVNPGHGTDSAGARVEAAGMSGHRHGTAEVSTKHANFIQSDSGGRADDVVALMCEVQDAVERSSGIVLRSEVRLVGYPDDIVDRFSAHAAYGVDDAAIAAAAARLGSLL